MVLALLVAGPLACKPNTTTTTAKPSDKAAVAEQKAAEIEREHYSRRACWHEKRVNDLADNESRWRARVRHAEKAAAWWKSIEAGDAKQCAVPIPPGS